MLGFDGFDIAGAVRRLRSLCDYWSLQGAARHVISAFEIALQDAKGKSLGMPVYDLLGGAKVENIAMFSTFAPPSRSYTGMPRLFPLAS